MVAKLYQKTQLLL